MKRKKSLDYVLGSGQPSVSSADLRLPAGIKSVQRLILVDDICRVPAGAASRMEYRSPPKFPADRLL
jgi:hypothetical protein